MKFIRSLKSLKGKTVLLRADFDVPHDGKKILDDHRIRAVIPTIEHLRKAGAKIVILSKLGRPEAVTDSSKWDKSESIMIPAEHLAKLLKFKLVEIKDRFPQYAVGHVAVISGDIRKPETRKLINEGPTKDIIVLENMRYYPEEAAGDTKLAKALAELGDLYVNEAFAVSHRSEMSVSVLPKYLPAYVGLNLEQEITALDRVLDSKAQPFVTIMGGIKISDKVGAIKNLAKKSDMVLIGGGLANLFFLAQGHEIGKSKVESEKIELAKELLRNFKNKIILPSDVVVAKSAKNGFSDIRVCKTNEVKTTEAILDIGPQTILDYSTRIKTAKKMVWNGPMGFFEEKPFSYGTMSVALVFSARSQGKCYGVIGGGDTLEAAAKAKIVDRVDFASTGGGAMLEYMSGKPLPGIKVLE
jgi:phosphoglycerate kinase